MTDASGAVTTDPDQAVSAEIRQVYDDGKVETHYLQKPEAEAASDR